MSHLRNIVYLVVSTFILTIGCSDPIVVDEYNINKDRSNTESDSLNKDESNTQLSQDKEDEKKLNKRKIITERLELNAPDSISFWAIHDSHIDVFNQISNEMISLRKFKILRAKEDKADEMLNKRLDIKKRTLEYEIELERELSEVISSKQIMLYFRMEESYRIKIAQERKRSNNLARKLARQNNQGKKRKKRKVNPHNELK